MCNEQSPEYSLTVCKMVQQIRTNTHANHFHAVMWSGLSFYFSLSTAQFIPHTLQSCKQKSSRVIYKISLFRLPCALTVSSLSQNPVDLVIPTVYSSLAMTLETV